MKWKEKTEEEENVKGGKSHIAFAENGVEAFTFCILNGGLLNDRTTAE